MAVKKSDLVENPKDLESLLRGFHGRGKNGWSTHGVDLNLDLSEARCVGRSTTIYYRSDKRDPNDPVGLGAQGYIKDFYHTQKPLSALWWYSATPEETMDALAEAAEASGFCEKVEAEGLLPGSELPEEVLELGILVGVDIQIGRSKSEIRFENFKLYVASDMKTLYGLVERNGKVLTDQILVWRSHDTYVCYRGIVN